MEITFTMLAQTVIAALLVTVGIVCYMYGDEEEIKYITRQVTKKKITQQKMFWKTTRDSFQSQKWGWGVEDIPTIGSRVHRNDGARYILMKVFYSLY